LILELVAFSTACRVYNSRINFVHVDPGVISPTRRRRDN
jgi:hypothetical protein